MPLIFSTYKLKLGGIVPTSNLFSKFLEKNVEESYALYTFHTVVQAFWKNSAQSQIIDTNVEYAGAQEYSTAQSFYNSVADAQNQNNQYVTHGEFSGTSANVLFLYYKYFGSTDFNQFPASGTFLSQAAYGDAHQFYTYIGTPEYELVFDFSHTAGVLFKYGQAHPFFAESAKGWDYVNDKSYAFSAIGNYGSIDKFYAIESESQTTNFKFDWINSARFCKLRSAEPLFVFYKQAYQLTIEDSVEKVFDIKGSSYEPFMPVYVSGSSIASYYQIIFDAGYSKFSTAIPFYYETGFGFGKKHWQISDSATLSSNYVFESYWYFSNEAQTTNFDKLESGKFSKDRFEPSFFVYKNIGINSIPQYLNSEATRTKNNDAFVEPIIPIQEYGFQYFDFGSDIGNHSGYSLSPLFYYYKNIGIETNKPIFGYGKLSKLRSAEELFVFTNVGVETQKHVQEFCGGYVIAFYEIVFDSKYFVQTTNALEGCAEESQLSKLRVGEPYYFYTNVSYHENLMYAAGATKVSFVFVAPCFTYESIGHSKYELVSGTAVSESESVTLGIYVALYKNTGRDFLQKDIWEHGRFSSYTNGFNPLFYSGHFGLEIGFGTVIVKAFGRESTQAQHFFTFSHIAKALQFSWDGLAEKSILGTTVVLPFTFGYEASKIKTLAYYQTEYSYTTDNVDFVQSYDLYTKESNIGKGFLPLSVGGTGKTKQADYSVQYNTSNEGRDMKSYWWAYNGCMEGEIEFDPTNFIPL